jgi:hypothetical protein
MKASWSLSILVAVVAYSLIASGLGQSSADRPPGVDADRWVPISDTVGIVMRQSMTTSVPGFSPDRRMIVPGLRQGTGVLMVKVEGVWMRVDLALPEPRVQPLL